MSKSPALTAIRLRGVRHNNLKNFDLDLPLNKLIVVTGLSGSGKSSLAFDTLFAEGQRRYIETFSPYARQFFDRMDKPRVDSIEGIPPAIAIEQRNSVRTTRSTVGTMTEICDYMKLLWPQLASLHCSRCGQVVVKESPRHIWETLCSQSAELEALVTFDLPLTEKLPLKESFALVARQGYQRVLLWDRVRRLDEALSEAGGSPAPMASLTVVQDRVRFTPAHRPRFVEACEQAYHFGKGQLAVRAVGPSATASLSVTGQTWKFSNRLHCARCNIEYQPASSALFSFNHPLGACPTCRGFGRTISIDYSLALPDRSRTLAQGVVKPWLTGMSAECQTDLIRFCRREKIPTDVPFRELAQKWQTLVIEGEPGYGKDASHEWPHCWYGVKGYFRWLESRTYKMHVRVLLSRYRNYTPCPDCHGARFRPESLLYRVPLAPEPDSRSSRPAAPTSSLTLADFYALPVRDALQTLESISVRVRDHAATSLILEEALSRLRYLERVGLGYLTLDRPTRSLSGGETERVNLTTCLGTRLVNTLFVLDEPSVGLHPRDTQRLIEILLRLRDAGNTVLVVEHEATIIRAADQIIDLGPGHGATGGNVVFQGAYEDILKAPESLTGRYLSGEQVIEIPARRAVHGVDGGFRARRGNPDAVTIALHDAILPPSPQLKPPQFLKLSHATRHNLRELSVEIPLDRFVCVTGVSGSGKTTLVREVLLPSLTALVGAESAEKGNSETVSAEETEGADAPEVPGNGAAVLEGAEHLDQVVLVDQSSLGRTPRSNPAVYVGAFDDIRELFARSDLAVRRGLKASAFSFNSSQGQCERCRGAGFEKIEMQFLSDVFIRCPDCDGRRYRAHILEVKLSAPSGEKRSALSIADLLDATVDEAVDFLLALGSPRADSAASRLSLLKEVGLGYLRLGQPINTLSGGESQRLKLVRHLAAVTDLDSAKERILFIFDEPTTGLHFDDVRVLLRVFQRLTDAGHSVLVVEHNLDVIKSADWVIDLGPEAGDMGGRVVAQGTPEEVATCAASHTGQALRGVISPRQARRSRQSGPSRRSRPAPQPH